MVEGVAPYNEPRVFFEENVIPALKEWRAAPCDIRKAKLLATALNDTAEHYWYHWRHKDSARIYDAVSATEFRKRLAEIEGDDFQIVVDVANSHKHVERTHRPKLVTLSTAIFPTPDSSGEIILSIMLDSKEQRPFELVLHRVVVMWQRLL